MAPTLRQQAEAKLKALRDRVASRRDKRVVESNIDNNNNRNNDNSLNKISQVTPSKRPKALQGHNVFDRSSHWDTPTKIKTS